MPPARKGSNRTKAGGGRTPCGHAALISAPVGFGRSDGRRGRAPLNPKPLGRSDIPKLLRKGVI